MERIITVFAADSYEAMRDDGAAIEMSFDFVGQAKLYAQHLVTEAYRRASESSTVLGYAAVTVGGIVTHEFFAKETK